MNVPIYKECALRTGSRNAYRRFHRGLAPAILIALLFVTVGCSRDIAPVSESDVKVCLSSKGEHPVEFVPERQGVPEAHRRLVKENGFEGSLAILGKKRGQGQAWAYLFFFNGSKRAEDVLETLQKSMDDENVRFATTRRQNVIVIYGKPGTYGSAKTKSNSRDLDSCFDQAIE